MKPTQKIGTLIAAFVMACVVSSSQAAIMLEDSFSMKAARTGNGADTVDTVSSWGLDGGNAIAVYFTAENAAGVTMKYGTEDLTVIQVGNVGNNHRAAIGYLINPTASVADVVISATNSSGSRLSHAYSVLSLSGVGSASTELTRTGSGNLSYTTTMDGGYVMAASANNNFNGPASSISDSGGNLDLFLENGPVDGNYSAAHVHGDVPTAGSYTVTYGSGTLPAVVVAFDMASGTPQIPEPASLAMGLAGLGLMVARRRR